MRALRTLRRGPRSALPALRGSPQPLRPPRRRADGDAHGAPLRVRTRTPHPRPDRTRAGSGALKGRRRRRRALHAVRRSGLVPHRARQATTRHLGPRRPPVGRQGEPATTQACRRFRTRLTAACRRDLPAHRTSEFERTRGAARSAATAQRRNDPDRTVGPRRRRRRSAHGGVRRSRARPRRLAAGQCREPRNQRQSILRRRSAATPGRDRCDLPGRHWQVVGSVGPGPEVPSGQRPRRGSGTRGAARARTPNASSRWRR